MTPMGADEIITQLQNGHHDMTAAAFHWFDDRELAETLLEDAIIHRAAADRLSGGAPYESIYAAYFEYFD